MSELSGLQIFKYLPGARKNAAAGAQPVSDCDVVRAKAEYANCKECGCPTCMAFALKLAKNQIELEKCRHCSDELIKILTQNRKQPQKTIQIGDLKIGGENVLYRHEKTFINPTALAVMIDTDEPDWQEKLKRVEEFEITRVNEILKVNLIIFKGQNLPVKQIHQLPWNEFQNLPIKIITDSSFSNTAKTLIETRTHAIQERNESDPVCVYLPHSENSQDLCARASFYICQYANMLVFEDFDETIFATLLTLRQNIFTDPQKPLQVESKVYEFNEPHENSPIFLTTNFALTYFAVANELENLDIPSYLVVTPANGMSILTAWSAEKFTAQIVARTLKKFDLANKVKTREIIIPGLLAHMKKELEEEIPEFKIIVGTNEAYGISELIKDSDFT